MAEMRQEKIAAIATSAEEPPLDDEGEVEKQGEKIFDIIDTDRDGVISKGEFRNWQKWQSHILDSEMVAKNTKACCQCPCLTDGKRGKFLYNQYMHPNMEPEKETLKWYRWRLACFMESPPMQVFILVLVVLNAIFQGVQIDMQTDDNYEIFEDIEITVLSIFLLEILLKIFGFGLRRYLGYRMNIFDLSVVVMAIIGEAVAASENHGGGSSIGQELSVLRLLRIFSLLKGLRLAEPLNRLVQCIIIAAKNAVWIGVLFLLVIYVYAILGRTIIGNHLALETYPHLLDRFDSVPKSMYTLFQVLTGDSWAEAIANPIAGQIPYIQIYFVSYVVICAIMMLNLVTAVFVESLSEAREHIALEAEQEHNELKHSMMQNIAQLFISLDADNSGFIDKDELAKATAIMKQEQFATVFEELGLTSDQIDEYMEHWKVVFDKNSGEQLSYHDFLHSFSELEAHAEKKATWKIETLVHVNTQKVDRVEERLVRIEQLLLELLPGSSKGNGHHEFREIIDDVYHTRPDMTVTEGYSAFKFC